MWHSPFTRWGTFLLLLAVLGTGLMTGCQTLREVSNLRDVQFRIDRVSEADLAGVSIDRLRSYNDLSGADIARLGASFAQGDVPLSFQLHLEAENPESNDVNARLTEMDWTLLLNDRETITGTFDQEIVLSPGEPKDIPVGIQLDLIEFFDDNLRGLVDLAAAVGGEGPPTNVKLKVQPTIQTRLGPMRYPNPITVVSEQVGETQADDKDR